MFSAAHTARSYATEDIIRPESQGFRMNLPARCYIGIRNAAAITRRVCVLYLIVAEAESE